MKQNAIIGFFLKHPEYFKTLISHRYPFKKTQLDKYKDLLDWYYISANSNITWTFEILDAYKESINWEMLTVNKNAFKDIILIDKFADRIDWMGSDRLGGDSIASNSGLLWNIEFIESVQSKINFKKLSENNSVEWSEELIDKYLSSWEMNQLATNESIPWTLRLFDKYLGPSNLFFHIQNETLTGDFDFVEKYKSKLDWSMVCRNTKLPWIEKNLLEYWKEYIEWNCISFNEVFFKNDEYFFYYHLDKWDFNDSFFRNDLSNSKYLPWSFGFIEAHMDTWDWTLLSTNEGLPWSIKLIDRYSNLFQWGGFIKDPSYENGIEILNIGPLSYKFGLMSVNSLPWSIEFLNYYEDKLEFKALECNDGVWEKAFKPYIDDKLIDIVFRLL